MDIIFEHDRLVKAVIQNEPEIRPNPTDHTIYYNRFNRTIGEFEEKFVSYVLERRKRKGKEWYFNIGGEFAYDYQLPLTINK
jgi:hypothetical protein